MNDQPLVHADLDLRDFAFMPVDVRRLLTSETWLTATGDEKAAAMTLWLESWHQVPAGSLPDNDRMLAILSQAGGRWPKVKAAAMRGWVMCSDGRFYHPVVCEKAIEAWGRKQSLVNKRNKDTERLKRWREQRRNDGETHNETRNETRFVAERQGQGQGQGHSSVPNGTAPVDAETELYRRGREVLGKDAGGIVKRLIGAKGGSVQLARAAIETASTKANPREYVGAIIRNKDPPADHRGDLEGIL